MQNQPTIKKLLDLMQRNKQSLQILKSNNFPLAGKGESIITDLIAIKSVLDKNLTDELIKHTKTFLVDKDKRIDQRDSLTEKEFVSNVGKDVLAGIIKYEEDLAQESQEINAMDLSAFGQVRDILHIYNFKLQKLLMNVEEVS